MPGTTTPEPNRLPRLCVTQTRLPSRSAIENEVVWPCGPLRPRRLLHCSVGPATGLPSRTRARRLSTCSSTRSSRELLRRGMLLSMRTPAARRIARSTVSTCSTPLRSSLREVEAFEDAQRQQVLEPLAGRRRHMHRAAAIAHGDRILPLRRDLLEVGHRHVAAERLELRDDRVLPSSPP